MAVTYAPTRKHFQGLDPGHGDAEERSLMILRRELRWSYKRRQVGGALARVGSPSWRNRWRRRQDSNLRALAGQWFSRPPPSASRPLLRACVLAPLAWCGAASLRHTSRDDPPLRGSA